jgi:pyruvate,water dikinase
MRLVEDVIRRAQACGRKVGICGQAPSDYPEFARFLVRCGIDSISLNPDTILKTTQEILEVEKQAKQRKTARKRRVAV